MFIWTEFIQNERGGRFLQFPPLLSRTTFEGGFSGSATTSHNYSRAGSKVKRKRGGRFKKA